MSDDDDITALLEFPAPFSCGALYDASSDHRVRVCYDGESLPRFDRRVYAQRRASFPPGRLKLDHELRAKIYDLFSVILDPYLYDGPSDIYSQNIQGINELVATLQTQWGVTPREWRADLTRDVIFTLEEKVALASRLMSNSNNNTTDDDDPDGWNKAVAVLARFKLDFDVMFEHLHPLVEGGITRRPHPSLPYPNQVVLDKQNGEGLFPFFYEVRDDAVIQTAIRKSMLHHHGLQGLAMAAAGQIPSEHREQLLPSRVAAEMKAIEEKYGQSQPDDTKYVQWLARIF